VRSLRGWGVGAMKRGLLLVFFEQVISGGKGWSGAAISARRGIGARRIALAAPVSSRKPIAST